MNKGQKTIDFIIAENLIDNPSLGVIVWEEGACEKITEFLKEQQQEWVKCSERLPEDKSLVLIYIKDQVCRYVGFYNQELDMWQSNAIGEVTHWQPLPAPPEK